MKLIIKEMRLLCGFLLPICAALSGTSAPASSGQFTAKENPAFWAWAQRPPMGWNSYDAYGDSVTEAEVLANAVYQQQQLLKHGYAYVVVDYRWYDPGAHSSDLTDRAGAKLSADAYGRLLPAPNRFPSAAGGAGFKPLADRIHAMGLKFGIHVMRGIPRQAVAANLPIEGFEGRAADAANTASTCTWNPDMFGVAADKPSGKAWYRSLLRLYAAWGVDYIKVDDLSDPYSATEIEAIRDAIDVCGRPIVFSLSPGPAPRTQASHLNAHANLWRISSDFWDRWPQVNQQFDLLGNWLGCGGPGHWPDADMIPLGHLSIRNFDGGPDRTCRLTQDEQTTLITLWSLESSPLMLGMNLPDNDRWTESLLTNDEVLAIDQDPDGQAAVPAHRDGRCEAWVKTLADGSKAAGLFNRGETRAKVLLRWPDAALQGRQSVRDLWRQADLGVFDNEIVLPVEPHGAVLVRLTQIAP